MRAAFMGIFQMDRLCTKLGMQNFVSDVTSRSKQAFAWHLNEMPSSNHT